MEENRGGGSEDQARDFEVLIGRKPVLNYVSTALAKIMDRGFVIVKARGSLINKAIEVVEILRNRCVPNSKISEVRLEEEEVEDKSGGKTKVETIEIKLEKIGD